MMGEFGGDMWSTSYRTTLTLRQLNLVYHPWRQSPVGHDPQPIISPETNSHQLYNSAQLETTPASKSPMLRQSYCSHRAPQRLIEEMCI